METCKRVLSAAFFSGIFLLATIMGCSASSKSTSSTTSYSGLTEFKSVNGKFSVMVPETMTEKTDYIDDADGRTTMTTYDIDQGSAFYRVVVNDFPPGYISTQGTESMFEMEKKNNTKGGKLVKDEVITLEGYPGRMFIYEWSDRNLTEVERMFIVNDRVYQVLVVRSIDEKSGGETDQFLDSFKLIS